MTGEWRNLVLLNYAVDPAMLRDRVPFGTRLDLHRGRALVSIVGVRFTGLSLFGIPVPLHADFAQVNLRFYVRRDGRAGVVFIKQIVPSPLLSLGARFALNEHTAVHAVQAQALSLASGSGAVRYELRHRAERFRMPTAAAHRSRVRTRRRPSSPNGTGDTRGSGTVPQSNTASTIRAGRSGAPMGACREARPPCSKASAKRSRARERPWWRSGQASLFRPRCADCALMASNQNQVGG